MMDLIAKKYTRAILETFSVKEVESIVVLFSQLSKVLEDKKVCDFIYSPFLDKAKKEELLVGVFSESEARFENLIRVLVRSNRISAIPEITRMLEKKILADKKHYVAVLKIKEELDSATLQSIAKSLSSKLKVNLDVRQEKAAVDGIRLSVEDLGVEISFSKERFFTDLTNHILKAI
ncbi:F0F1 ATP synthase subunit delta [uncultured Helicobacter sp.]|uniref:F0F1 ATP synthase subunit delta n=1 Tax=uncultured Helicobacter sp. TaxID=175537 RepID=UPI001C3A894F|nr:F0F1 ATP synthase subunit delta [Candidatus Helicobacter avicola]